MATLAADSAESGGSPLKKHTVGEYLSALERLFVVENQAPWEPHLRSRSILRKSPKRDSRAASGWIGAAPAWVARRRFGERTP